MVESHTRTLPASMQFVGDLVEAALSVLPYFIEQNCDMRTLQYSGPTTALNCN